MRQLLAELPCPRLLGFSSHNGTLSLDLVNVNTCVRLWPNAHKKRQTEPTHADTCAGTHVENKSEELPHETSAARSSQLFC